MPFDKTIVKIAYCNENYFTINLENGTIIVYNYIDKTITKTFMPSSPSKGYYQVTPITTNVLKTHMAVSYNDNFDSNLDSSSNYLQTIRMLDYY